MPASNSRQKRVILVASDNTPLADRISGVLDEHFSLKLTTRPADIDTLLEQSIPRLVMLDPALISDTLEATITATVNHSSRARVIILEDDKNRPVDQLALFKLGVYGFLSHTITPTLMLKAAHAVCNDEIWIPRLLISKLIGELARDTSTGKHTLSFAGNSSIQHLTPREMQVAEMVHRGGNNKSIARKLDISERTVKAHLSAIFRKLDIENRLHLALYFNKMK